jgi:acyl-CoA reductase-like NAD-dependent aldehyde dehydrogenase
MAAVITWDRLYINGEWLPSEGGQALEVVNPATGEVIGTVPNGTVADADRAVDASCAAFPAWSAAPVSTRAEALRALAEGLAGRAEEIATTVTQEVGTPIERSRPWQAAQPAHVTDLYARLVQSYPFEEAVANSIVVREPIGPAVGIAPWNFPLHQAMLKVAPALAAGCTVVLKPSSLSPLNAFILADIIDFVGLPPGVFNLVTGPGVTVGECLAAHPDVAMVSLTGSTEAGRRVAELAAQTIKRVTLELGGKSANVILPDADLETAVRNGVDNCYANAGQTCAAWTRMLVPRSSLPAVEEIAADAARGYRLGDPLDDATTMGPLISADQRDRVLTFIGKGVQEGAKLLTGGPEPPPVPAQGFFVWPTVFSEVDRGMLIAQEEIFGPVLCIMPYRDEDEAVAIANDTIYGLHGGVWSADPARALRVARRLQTGRVDINGAAFNYEAPFGGYKQSGTGRELGTYGLEEFLELKAIST